MVIKERVLRILKDTLEVESVDETCSQQNCPAWDSMAHLNLVVDLEDAFGVRLEPEDISKMKSYEDIVKIVAFKIQTNE